MLTVAVNWRLAPEARVTLDGVTLTEIGGGGVIVTVELADLVASATLVAVMVAVVVVETDGAV